MLSCRKPITSFQLLLTSSNKDWLSLKSFLYFTESFRKGTEEEIKCQNTILQKKKKGTGIKELVKFTKF